MGFEKLQMIISEVLGVQAEDVLPEMSFVDDLGADSLEIFQIIMAIEEEFDVVIDENAIEMIETVEQAYQAIGQSDDI